MRKGCLCLSLGNEIGTYGSPWNSKLKAIFCTVEIPVDLGLKSSQSKLAVLSRRSFRMCPSGAPAGCWLRWVTQGGRGRLKPQCSFLGFGARRGCSQVSQSGRPVWTFPLPCGAVGFAFSHKFLFRLFVPTLLRTKSRFECCSFH